MQECLPNEQIHQLRSEDDGQVYALGILVKSMSGSGSCSFHPDTGKLLESFWVSVSASDIFLPAWLRGWFSALVFKQKFSQIDGGGFGTSAGGARASKSGKYMEEEETWNGLLKTIKLA